ncbi:hypothetical protein KSP40_PGU002699 [Platanthera guangdongensis]|uniref:Uncharacterized protein n=1 Tax=Platanthera guangdongensis TaxID=2320717 RepID=A0ABR2MEY9_9ASPA
MGVYSRTDLFDEWSFSCCQPFGGERILHSTLPFSSHPLKNFGHARQLSSFGLRLNTKKRWIF